MREDFKPVDEIIQKWPTTLDYFGESMTEN